jgi:hypothetical protein
LIAENGAGQKFGGGRTQAEKIAPHLCRNKQKMRGTMCFLILGVLCLSATPSTAQELSARRLYMLCIIEDSACVPTMQSLYREEMRRHDYSCARMGKTETRVPFYYLYMAYMDFVGSRLSSLVTLGPGGELHAMTAREAMLEAVLAVQGLRCQ